jgi:hypothetical protein
VLQDSARGHRNDEEARVVDVHDTSQWQRRTVKVGSRTRWLMARPQVCATAQDKKKAGVS